MSTDLLPQKLGDFDTIWKALAYAAQSDRGMTFCSAADDTEYTVTYAQLRDQAMNLARRLLSLSLARYDRVGLVGETGPDFFSAFYACQIAGLVPCPLPLTIYVGGKDAYISKLTSMAAAARLSLLVGPATVKDCAIQAAFGAGTRALTYDDLATLPVEGTPQPLQADDPAYIQYSSGSTSEPKGIIITQKALCKNISEILQFGLKVRPSDRTLSWLPLYHDMGLVGFSLAPMFSQINADYLSPFSFARRPGRWLELLSAKSTTITFSPGFGYKLVCDRFKGDPTSLDLSNLRVAGIGGDTIRAEVLEEFAAHFKVAGFKTEAFLPSYGLAEGVLAVTFSDLSTCPIVDKPIHAIRRYVSCGRPLPSLELSIMDDCGRRITGPTIGRIWIRGPSVMTEYFNNSSATQRTIQRNGYLDTGDLGYIVDGRLVVTGRGKELILLRGRNVWPDDVEWAATRIHPLGSGDAMAFGVETGTEEELVLLVQCGLTDPRDRESLRARIIASVNQSVGVASHVVLVPPRSLPVTSSGKMARWRAKQLYLEGHFPMITNTSGVEDEALT